MHERAKPVVPGAAPGHQLLDDLTIGKLDVRPGGVSEQLPREVARELVLVREQELLVLVDVPELAAISKGVYFHDYGGAACHHGFCAAMSLADADEALNRLDDAVRQLA